MAALVERVQRVDIRAYEAATPDTIVTELQPQASTLVGAALALVGEVLVACQRESEGQPPAPQPPIAGLRFEQAIDRALSDAGNSALLIGDIAFMAKLELRQRHDRVGALNKIQSTLSVLGECDSALRRIRKALGAIDIAIASHHHTPKRIDFQSELAISLQVRSAYAKFRRRMLSTDASTGADLTAKLRGAGTNIAVMVGWAVYPDLRIRDRLQLRELQRRILAWLLPQHRVDLRAGMRLWQDLLAFVEMLPQVNRRQELLEHDAALFASLGEPLSALLPEGEVHELLRARLRLLAGLDDSLDRLVADPESRAGEITERLKLLAASLQQSPSGKGDGHGW
ncbi:MAG: hypothetical protein JST54_29090 [Deltaproteobacteria bacterium]|nr:hypothetical protein [Deltaproteobacteria bacterium]